MHALILAYGFTRTQTEDLKLKNYEWKDMCILFIYTN